MLHMKTIGPYLLLLAGHPICLGQSFTQTSGGVSSEVGIGATPIDNGYRVSMRTWDVPTTHQGGTVHTLSSTGGFLSASQLAVDGMLFLQAHVNAADGSAFLVGSSIPTGETDHDGSVVKLDPDGSVAWAMHPSIPGSQQYRGGAALSDGGIVVCGISGTEDGHEALVTRFDANGVVVWNHVQPSGTDAEAYAVAIEGSNVMITGRQKTFGGTDQVLFLRMDLDGAVIWNTSKGGAANEECRAIISTGGGNFIAAGWTNSYGTRDLTRDTIPFHVYIVAIELDGDTLWTKALGDTLFERHAYALEAAPNGDLLIAGERSTPGLSDALLLRASAVGGPIWERTIDTGKEERIVHLIPLNDGLVGTGRSFGEFSDQLLFIRRNADGF
ncbi:MAG TPA: hypothetical protein PLB89_06510 [Flavobacteriales bacterium]|nr:hypothetical protein [Flavobacteriales bacterium]